MERRLVRTGDIESASVNPKSRARACVSVCRWMCRWMCRLVGGLVGGLGNLWVNVCEILWLYFVYLCSFGKHFELFGVCGPHKKIWDWGYNSRMRFKWGQRETNTRSGRIRDEVMLLWTCLAGANSSCQPQTSVFFTSVASLFLLSNSCGASCSVVLLHCLARNSTLLRNNVLWNNSTESQGTTSTVNGSAPHDLCPKPSGVTFVARW